MNWKTLTTPQKAYLIASVWREGISAAEIAAALECSRNSIIGYYSRHRDKMAAYPLQMSMIERNRTGNVTESTRIRNQYADNYKRKRPEVKVIAPPEVEVHEIPSTAGHGLYVRLEDCTGCAWPLNDGGPYLFCGHAKFGKYAYCEHHHERSRGRGTPSERSAHRVSELHASS